MDREYSPLPRKPLAPSFTIWTSRHKILFPGHCSALTLFPSLTKLVEILLLPMEMLSSVEGHRESILSRPTYFLRTRSVLSAKGFALPFCKVFSHRVYFSRVWKFPLLQNSALRAKFRPRRQGLGSFRVETLSH